MCMGDAVWIVTSRGQGEAAGVHPHTHPFALGITEGVKGHLHSLALTKLRLAWLMQISTGAHREWQQTAQVVP